MRTLHKHNLTSTRRVLDCRFFYVDFAGPGRSLKVIGVVSSGMLHHKCNVISKFPIFQFCGCVYVGAITGFFLWFLGVMVATRASTSISSKKICNQSLKLTKITNWHRWPKHLHIIQDSLEIHSGTNSGLISVDSVYLGVPDARAYYFVLI